MRLLAMLAALCAVALCLPALASAAPPPNDNYTGAISLAGPIDIEFGDTTEATTANPEPLTLNGNGFCGGNKVGRTVWYKVTANGSNPISVNSHGSNFDTIMAVYNTDGTGAPSATSGPPSINNAIFCSDDAGDFALGSSRIRFTPPVPNKTYLVQLGGFVVDTTTGAETGQFQITRGDTTWTYNQRAQAQTVTADTQFDTDNIGATEELPPSPAPQEDLLCESDTGNSPLGSTLWFKFTATEHGTATFTSNGMDTVMQVYRGNENTPIKCQDDGGNGLGSRVQVPVTPGDYYVQVGGFGAVQGFFTLITDFQIDLDRDDDNSNRPADCNDDNSGIHPGAVDVPDNGVDEDCDGVQATDLDRDDDGFNNDRDCNDGNRDINPGANDVPGNGVDENCDGSDAVNLDADGDGIPRPRDCNDNNRNIYPGARDTPGDRIDQDCQGGDAAYPELTLDYDYFFRPNGSLRTLTAKVRRGARVRVSCRGRGCPRAKSYTSRGRTLNLRRPFRRALGNRARIDIRATRRGYIGKVARITFFSNKDPVDRILCLLPGSNRPRRSC